MVKKIEFDIKGMHCDSCAVGIQMVLQNTEGVIKSFVDYEKKSAEVEFDEDKIKTEDLIKLLK